MPDRILEMLKGAKLRVARGRNYFRMSRGSFRYIRALYNRRTLKKGEVRLTEEGLEIPFTDERDGKEILFRARGKNGSYDVSLEGDLDDVNRYSVNLPVKENEHFYGCGETYSKFDLTGEKVRIFVAEHQNAGRITGKIIREKIRGPRPKRTLPFPRYESYYAQPTFVSSDKYYVHADSSRYAEITFRKRGVVRLHFEEKPSFHIESKDTFEELSLSLSRLLGSYGPLPDWIYDGAILAIQEGPAVIDEKIRKAEEVGTKICGIWSQDWCGCRRTGFGYQVMWNWEADEELYPDLKEKIEEWKKKGIRFLGYINPFLALEKPLYKYAHEHGYCVKDAKGEDYLVTITTFPAAMIDFTNPEAYDWYKTIIKENMIGIGLSGWMADFGEYLPMDCVLYDGDPEEWHNKWPAVWAKMNREAVEECGKKDEIFFFMRAGYTGSVRNSCAMWTGDQHVDWSVDDGLPSVIPASLSLGMSGETMVHSDVGGYTTIMHMTRTKELLMRWEEMNAFSPLFRSHEGNQPNRSVQFDADEELLQHLGKMSRIHVSLKPYLKSVEEEAVRGIPMMRPLFYHYEEEWTYTEKTEYLLGRDLLVAPVLEKGAAERSVTLPDDEWVHIFTGKEYGKGTRVVDAPMGCPPVFVRKTAINTEWYKSLQEEIQK